MCNLSSSSSSSCSPSTPNSASPSSSLSTPGKGKGIKLKGLSIPRNSGRTGFQGEHSMETYWMKRNDISYGAAGSTLGIVGTRSPNRSQLAGLVSVIFPFTSPSLKPWLSKIAVFPSVIDCAANQRKDHVSEYIQKPSARQRPVRKHPRSILVKSQEMKIYLPPLHTGLRWCLRFWKKQVNKQTSSELYLVSNDQPSSCL